MDIDEYYAILLQYASHLKSVSFQDLKNIDSVRIMTLLVPAKKEVLQRFD